jgi:hypothetical protein
MLWDLKLPEDFVTTDFARMEKGTRSIIETGPPGRAVGAHCSRCAVVGRKYRGVRPVPAWELREFGGHYTPATYKAASRRALGSWEEWS